MSDAKVTWQGRHARTVETTDEETGDRVTVLEVKDGQDAVGQPRWVDPKLHGVGDKTLRAVFTELGQFVSKAVGGGTAATLGQLAEEAPVSAFARNAAATVNIPRKSKA